MSIDSTVDKHRIGKPFKYLLFFIGPMSSQENYPLVSQREVRERGIDSIILSQIVLGSFLNSNLYKKKVTVIHAQS